MRERLRSDLRRVAAWWMTADSKGFSASQFMLRKFKGQGFERTIAAGVIDPIIVCCSICRDIDQQQTIKNRFSETPILISF